METGTTAEKYTAILEYCNNHNDASIAEVCSALGVSGSCIARARAWARKETDNERPHAFPDFSNAVPEKRIDVIETLKLATAITSQSPSDIDKDYRKIVIHTEKPIAIMKSADWHFGGLSVDYQALLQHVEFLLNTDGMYLQLFGDDLNLMIMHGVTATRDDIFPPEKQIRWLESFVDECLAKGKLLSMGWGNHSDEFTERAAGFGIVKLIVEKKVPYFRGFGYLDLALKMKGQKEVIYPMAFAHKVRFNSFMNHLHGNKRLQQLHGEYFGINRPLAREYITAHCFSDDTEILALDGWKRREDLVVGERIYNMDLETGRIVEDKIASISTYDSFDKLYRLKNTHVDLLLTDEHGIVFRKHPKPGKHAMPWEKVPLSDFFERCANIDIPCSGILNDEDYVGIRDEFVELLGLLISEGHFRKNQNLIQLYQRKGNEGYIVDVLERCGLRYSIYERQMSGRKFEIRGKQYETRTDYITFNILNPSAQEVREIINSKTLPDICYKFSRRQVGLLLNALVYGDGSRISDAAWAYFSADIGLLDDLQRLCAVSGYRTVLSHERESGAVLYIHTEHSNTNFYIIPSYGKNVIEEIPYSGIVWCPSTSNGTVIARRNGRVVVTGNTHDPAYLTEGCIPDDRVHFIKCGTFNTDDTFSQRFYGQGKIGVPTVVYRPDRVDSVCFPTPWEAAIYMRGLEAVGGDE